MRNFKKVMALAISVAAVCTSVSAFAAELEYNVTGDVTGTYDKAANALTLNVEGAAGDKTVLVLDNGIEAINAKGENILYINQYTESETAYDTMKLKGETALAAGTYAVKIGYTDANGDFAIKNASIVVTEKQAETQTITFYLGDVDGNNAANVTDADYIVNKILGGSTKVGTSEYAIGEKIADNYYLGDVDGNNAANVTDADYIVNKILGGSIKVGTSAHEIGAKVTIEVPVN